MWVVWWVGLDGWCDIRDASSPNNGLCNCRGPRRGVRRRRGDNCPYLFQFPSQLSTFALFRRRENRRGRGEVVCVRGCDTNASNYCHMRSLSLSRSESFPRHSRKQTHSSLVCLPRLPPFHHSSPLFSITIISTRVKQSLLEHGQKYYSYCNVTTMYLGLVAKF